MPYKTITNINKEQKINQYEFISLHGSTRNDEISLTVRDTNSNLKGYVSINLNESQLEELINELEDIKDRIFSDPDQ